MDETDSLRSKRCNEDTISLAPSTTESIIVEGELTELGIELEFGFKLLFRRQCFF